MQGRASEWATLAGSVLTRESAGVAAGGGRQRRTGVVDVARRALAIGGEVRV